MANTKVTSHVIANNAISASMIQSAAVTDAKLHSTLDLSSKTLTLPATTIPSASTATTQSASDNSTKIATTAYVTTAIANLVDSSPSSLNTLNELAAALNDDASFSTTVTNSLATKAPINNPTFTGSISHASDLTLDVGGDISLDADGGEFKFLDGGVESLVIGKTSGSPYIYPTAQDSDLIILGNDGGSQITALTLDMSEAGFATFNSGGSFGGTGALKIPVGTTGQRPTAATGQIRWNSTDGALEVYNGTAWTAVGTGTSNKVLDTFTGDGSNRTFTLSVTPANEDAIMVFIDGAYQEKSDYVLTNNSLVLDTAPLNNEKIAVHTTTSAVHDGTSAVNQQFTASGSATFTLSQSPGSENNTQVYINGVYQQKTDYTVTGNSLVFDTAPTTGDIVEVNMFTVSTLGNTDTVTEGVSNLYHTTARARGAISVSGNAISYNSSTGVLTANFEEGPVFTSDVTLTSATTNKPHFNIVNTNGDATAPVLNFKKDSASPGNNDEVGRIYMYSDDSAGNPFEAFLAIGKATNVTNGSEGSSFDMYTYSSGVQTKTLSFKEGKVGVGTNSPQVKVHIDESSGANLMLTRTYASTTGDLGFLRWGNTNWDSNLAEIVAVQDGANDSARLEFKTQPTGGGTTTRMTILSGGNVGIGTNNPATKLDIEGDTTTYAGMSKIYLTDTASNSESRNWAIGNGGSGYGHFTIGRSIAKNGDPMSSGTHTVPFQIDHQDNIGIGVTPTAGIGLPLQIKSTVGYVGLRLDGTGSAGVWDLYSSYSGGKYMFGIYDRANTSYNLVTTEDGLVGIGTETPGTFDSRANNLVVRDTGDGGITIVTGDSSDARIAFTIAADTGLSNGQIHYDNNNDQMNFATGGSDRVSINNDGYVSMYRNANEYGLELKSAGTRSGLVLKQPGTNNINGSLLLLASDNTLRLGTASVYNIHMNQSGYNTMPNQPVAIYTHTNNNEAGAYNYTWGGTGAQTLTMKPQTAVVNRGNMYNTSNGRFTAPVAGIYRYGIHGNLYTAGLVSNAYFTVRILKNGSHYLWHYESNGIHAAAGWLYKNYSGLISLGANEYIEMQLTSNNLSATTHFGWDLNTYTHYEFQLLY